MSFLSWISRLRRRSGPFLGRGRLLAGLAAALTAASLNAPVARAVLPSWLQHVVGASTAEAALYRLMKLPVVEALYPRPPKEAQAELARLISSTPDQAELFQLRARADEQALDEDSAERDWKLYVTKAKNPIAAKLELADFYHRRLLAPQELAVLYEVATAPAQTKETYLDPLQQRSWVAFDRLIALASDQGLPPSRTASILNAFVTRYPEQPAVYALALKFRLNQSDFVAAEELIARYRKQFPQDAVFPIRAEALVAFHQGGAGAALDVYDRTFQPLWPPELIQSYFALLEQTHRQRAFVASQRALLLAHPDGPQALNALSRVFYYDQQAGRLDAAQRTLDAFRVARESRSGTWTAQDLYTLASLTAATHSYAESARYNFALASTAGALPGGEPAAQCGLAGLVQILLQAPDQPLALGAQNLTLYRDIATLDQGPGYWNGILSLWLNGTSAQQEYNNETTKAQPYFNRSKAAELLTELDRRFPSAPERAALHAQLIRAVSLYGEPAAVIAQGKEFLAAFPGSPDRLAVADLMADAYAREDDTDAEFALYDAQLADLAARTNGLPLTAAASGSGPVAEPSITVTLQDSAGNFTASASTNPLAENSPPGSRTGDEAAGKQIALPPLASRPSARSLPEAEAYTRTLDRYLGRLTGTGNLPRALTVLRTQLDRNPDDPLLYERLAAFLQQNNFSAQQEKVFQQAISRFQQPSWYGKLARAYLREKKREDFAALTRQVTGIFSGTDLDAFFSNVQMDQPVGPQLALDLNLYAAKRFPHDLVFTSNLLAAYRAPVTRNSHAYDLLLRSHWWESPALEEEFLAYLSSTGQLNSELASLSSLPANPNNPAATHELAELDVFTSHFEQAAPLLSSIAELYPADPDRGDQAVSIFRSLAYLDPTGSSTARAVALETNLLNAAPDSPQRLATLGDLYAEPTGAAGEDLASARPYLLRIPTLHPGSTQGFLASATIFWDYFQFDEALAQISTARTRFHSGSLFAYEAGAIEESRSNQSAAVTEYINAILHPLDHSLKLDSADAVADAFFKPPSDAADSSLWASAQSFVGMPEASGRLLTLARRKSTRGVVDLASAKAFADNQGNSAALTLRADVLAAQHQGAELTRLLSSLFDDALAHASTFDQAEVVGGLAQARNLTEVYERSLSKQAVLTLDPVAKIELQYTLARSLEARKDNAGAARIIDTVYQANPQVLGVVRTTTDFYVRNAQPEKAIATLVAAAKSANPSLARDFTLEAANRANEANDPAQARLLATGLLAQTPYDARVLDLIATSYAQAHDDAGLTRFYLALLQSAQAAPGINGEARRQNIALIRRGLIPALTRLGDFAGATSQYIALLSAFPEDAATAQEAALYALKHQREAQLVGFLQTTVKQSPRDSRFATLLAQTETTLGDLPAAEVAYNQAISIRKDRAALYIARAEIELRLSQTDAREAELAAVDFQKLYLLTYHDPSWMVRLAELRARQRRPADAVHALEAAYITGHPGTASDFFTVANQLEKWNLLTEARGFAEQAVRLAGPGLLVPGNGQISNDPSASGPVVYARILTRLGKADEAVSTLVAARRAARLSAASPDVLAAELARGNITGDEAKDFRANFAADRIRAADASLGAAVTAIGAAVKTFYTPEQKLAYAGTLDRIHNPANAGSDSDLAIEAAASAGLADREAEWRKQLLLNEPLQKANASELQTYVALEQSRLAYKELAQTLEGYAVRVKRAERDGIRKRAAQAYRDAGDPADEMRVERSVVLDNDPTIRDRFFDLLLRRDRAALIAIAGSNNATLADAALNYAVAHAEQAEALAAVERRGQKLPPVWTPASASLIQTFFAGPLAVSPSPDQFTRALGSEATIGASLAGHPDPAQQLTGDNFFFYASRFGIFLATVPTSPSLPDAEDFLPAALEASPTLPAPYLGLARTYAEAGNVPAALVEYNHVLELAPSDSSAPATQDEIAVLLYRAGRKDEALARWHEALSLLLRMQQHAIYPETFFTSLESTITHLGRLHLLRPFRPDIDAVIQPYLAKNGNYRSNELLKAVYTAASTPQEGASAIITLGEAASSPDAVLSDISSAPWLDASSRQAILVRRLALADDAPASGEQESYALGSIRRDLLESYMDAHNDAKAQALLDSIPESKRSDPRFSEARLVLAARAGRLDPLLAAYRASPDTAPSDAVLTSAADDLDAVKSPGASPQTGESKKSQELNQIAARALREFTFDHKQLEHTLLPTDFLALAQSRIKTGDLPGALTLLHRLTLQPPAPAGAYPDSPTPDPYANIDSAAALLEREQHFGEAIPFLQSLVQLTPWNSSYRLRLAEAEQAFGSSDHATADFLAIAHDNSAPYELRAHAASCLRKNAASATADLGSRELNFLAHPQPPEAGRQPYFVQARLLVADVPTVAAGTRDTLFREVAAMTAGASSDTLLKLLLIQPATADPSATLAILPSIRSTQSPSYRGSASPSDDADNDTSTDEGTDQAPEAPAASTRAEEQDENALPAESLPASTLDLPTQIRLAVQLSTLSQRDNDLESALGYAQLALSLAHDLSSSSALSRRRDELKVAVLLERRNAQRQPLLHAAIAQSSQVRPRLTASSIAPEDIP